MKIAKPAAIFSSITLASIFFIATKGLNLGLDFTGGVSAELNYAQPANQAEVIRLSIKLVLKMLYKLW